MDIRNCLIKKFHQKNYALPSKKRTGRGNAGTLGGKTYDDSSYTTTNDTDPNEAELLRGMAQLGEVYLMDEDPEGALNNVPMRPYINAGDLYRTIFTLKGRMESGESVFSLDEAEAIILEETTGQRYNANPLLNPH